MFAVGILLPSLLVGAIAWGVVGVLRQRGREEFTLATAAAFYAQVMMVAGLLAVLAGASVLVKLGLSLIDPSYSYASVLYGGMPTVDDQRAQDLIQAAMLIGIGGLVAAGHWLIARFVRGLPGGSAAWILQGTLIALTVLTGLAGFLSAIIGGYQVLTYFIVGAQQAGSFGDAVSVALVFLPAWAVVTTVLLRRLGHAPTRPTAAMTAA